MDHEEQITSELSSRAGLLAALAGLLIISFTEYSHLYGHSWFLISGCSLVSLALVLLVAGAIGFVYERPGMASDWEKWANIEVQNGREATDVDAELIRSVYDDYSICSQQAVIANNRKGLVLSVVSALLVAALLCLAAGVIVANICV
jgi:hypothetical protein